VHLVGFIVRITALCTHICTQYNHTQYLYRKI